MGPWTVKVERVTLAEFWQHGYRTGYRHGETGFPHLLDDERTFPDADVIPFPRATPSGGPAELFG